MAPLRMYRNGDDPAPTGGGPDWYAIVFWHRAQLNVWRVSTFWSSLSGVSVSDSLSMSAPECRLS